MQSFAADHACPNAEIEESDEVSQIPDAQDQSTQYLMTQGLTSSTEADNELEVVRPAQKVLRRRKPQVKQHYGW